MTGSAAQTAAQRRAELEVASLINRVDERLGYGHGITHTTNGTSKATVYPQPR